MAAGHEAAQIGVGRAIRNRNSRMLMDAYLRPFLPGIAPIAVALSAALAIINARCTAALRAACHPRHGRSDRRARGRNEATHAPTSTAIARLA